MISFQSQTKAKKIRMKSESEKNDNTKMHNSEWRGMKCQKYSLYWQNISAILQ